PNRVPRWLWNAAARARAFTPGVGTCSPRRYTTNNARVKRIRRFSSGTWKMFLIFSNMGPLGLRSRQFHLAACRLDRLLRALARRVDADGERGLDLSTGEQLDRTRTAHDALRLQPRRVHHGVRRRRRQLRDRHHLERHVARILEATLRQTALDRH